MPKCEGAAITFCSEGVLRETYIFAKIGGNSSSSIYFVRSFWERLVPNCEGVAQMCLLFLVLVQT